MKLANEHELDKLCNRPFWLPPPTREEIVAAALRKLSEDLARVSRLQNRAMRPGAALQQEPKP